MTPAEKKILMELHHRVKVLERYVEGLLGQGRENTDKLDRLTAQNKMLANHALRLLRHKEILMENFGRAIMAQVSEGREIPWEALQSTFKSSLAN